MSMHMARFIGVEMYIGQAISSGTDDNIHQIISTNFVPHCRDKNTAVELCKIRLEKRHWRLYGKVKEDFSEKRSWCSCCQLLRSS